MDVTIHHDLPQGLREEAAVLYWQAFGAKLGRVMGPDARALRLLVRIIRRDHAIVAMAGGRLVGLVGYKTPRGAFASGSFSDLWSVYGLGALWRAAVLRLLVRDVDNDRFLLDGLCVAAGARGQGVGTALLDAVMIEAQARGYRQVRLDVVDTNPRARALYERQGFNAVKTTGMGPLRHLFGFDSSTTMVRQV
ncbi:MAG: GNAT family N-acetyltransferase [Rhodobacteraceae bacterium]|jgi:ribosomal protein S18 acetylase RimI-like enzyme|nr:GNAT family N-acetyltransferase [Paracoccaceae bacterium]